MRPTAIGLVVLVGLTGCGRTATPPPAVTPTQATTAGPDTPAPYTGPELRLVSSDEHDFGNGTKGRVWTLAGHQLKSLTAKLVVAFDGNKEPGSEIVCHWDQPSPNVEAQLVLLLQDGSAFGVKGKRLPSLTIKFQTGGPDSTHRTSADAPHDTLPPRWSTSTASSTISHQELLFVELSGDTPAGKTTTWKPTEESLVEASKGKQRVLGVLIEWKK